MKQRLSLLLIVVFSWLIVSCTADESSKIDVRDLDPYSPDTLYPYELGDPEIGATLFNQPIWAGSSGCVNCHSLVPGHVLVGPSLYNLAETAENRIPGVIAADYIYLSIIQPNYYVVDGFPEGVMPANFGADLTNDEVTHLVSYLMTLTKEN